MRLTPGPLRRYMSTEHTCTMTQDSSALLTGDIYIFCHTVNKMGFVVPRNLCLYPQLWSQRRIPPDFHYLAIGDFGTSKGSKRLP